MLIRIFFIILAISTLMPGIRKIFKQLAVTSAFILLVFLWIDTGFPPFINGETSTLFFSALLLLRSLFNLNEKMTLYARLSSLVMIITGFFIPVNSDKIDAVLSSFWLGIHVPLFFLGYLSLTISFISSFFNDIKTEKREAMLSVFFLFSGLVTGAVWAEISWGRFFGFDPKEVWTLALIICLSGYFISDNRVEQKTILRTAFFLMVATYLVVSFILPGMHSYV